MCAANKMPENQPLIIMLFFFDGVQNQTTNSISNKG